MRHRDFNAEKVGQLMQKKSALQCSKSRPPDASEALRENLTGCWSRRINAEHRLIVRLEGELLMVRAPNPSQGFRLQYSDSWIQKVFKALATR
jgi:Txe/YoeB family toxin of Txe-Axe toxin-antitoxin module